MRWHRSGWHVHTSDGGVSKNLNPPEETIWCVNKSATEPDSSTLEQCKSDARLACVTGAFRELSIRCFMPPPLPFYYFPGSGFWLLGVRVGCWGPDSCRPAAFVRVPPARPPSSHPPPPARPLSPTRHLPPVRCPPPATSRPRRPHPCTPRPPPSAARTRRPCPRSACSCAPTAWTPARPRRRTRRWTPKRGERSSATSSAARSSAKSRPGRGATAWGAGGGRRWASKPASSVLRGALRVRPGPAPVLCSKGRGGTRRVPAAVGRRVVAVTKRLGCRWGRLGAVAAERAIAPGAAVADLPVRPALPPTPPLCTGDMHRTVRAPGHPQTSAPSKAARSRASRRGRCLEVVGLCFSFPFLDRAADQLRGIEGGGFGGAAIFAGAQGQRSGGPGAGPMSRARRGTRLSSSRRCLSPILRPPHTPRTRIWAVGLCVGTPPPLFCPCSTFVRRWCVQDHTTSPHPTPL